MKLATIVLDDDVYRFYEEIGQTEHLRAETIIVKVLRSFKEYTVGKVEKRRVWNRVKDCLKRIVQGR